MCRVGSLLWAAKDWEHIRSSIIQVPVEPKILTGGTSASQMLPQVSIVIKLLLRWKDSDTLPGLMGVSGIWL